uniref:Uncharacterized protein n=1 Tax=Vespula pensylvanica TaxID=30213 RepID=A0A834PEY0_VESPE|nr:hypothetical protein H0235_000691 [Vespula pensylvanica]
MVIEPATASLVRNVVISFGYFIHQMKASKVVAVGEGKSPEIPRGEDLAPVTAVVANNVGDGVHACSSGSGDGDGGSGGGGGGGGGGGDGGSSGGR